jgi:hypothetical protein
MPLRAVLASLAETYGFDYAASDEGIIVRQRGKPASGKRTTIGVWPPRPGPIYQLEFQVRVDSGTPFPGLPTLNTIPMEIPTRTLLSVKQGRQGMKEVTILDRNLLVAERRGVGAVVLCLEDRP